MLVGRSMHDGWLSNAYVVGDESGGVADFVDGGGKAWVRYDDGRDAIIGGSRVERG